MAVPEVHLANMALAKLVRDGNIQSLAEKGSNARYMKQFIDDAKLEFIEEFDWPQCRVVQDLQPVALDDTRGWSYAYLVPSDNVKIWRINGLDPESLDVLPWEMGMSSDLTSDRTYIYSNDTSLKLRFGSSRASLSRFSPKQRDLIATRLAMKTCLLITKDKNLLKVLENYYNLNLSKVSTAFANMEPETFDTEFTPELISVR